MIDAKLKNKSEQILKYTEDRLAQFKKGKQSWDRLMYSSILMYRGIQWFAFDLTGLRFRLSNQRRAIPRPITNKYAPTANAIGSALLKYDPKIVIAPQTDTLEDLNTAWAGNRIVKTIENEVNWLKRRTELTPWLVLTGNCFLFSGFDEKGGPVKPMVKISCPTCQFDSLLDPQTATQMPDCPECYATYGIKSTMRASIDGRSGKPMMTDHALGCQTTEVVNPFELFFDNRIQELQHHQCVIRIHQKNIEWARARWPDMQEELQPYHRSELSARLLNGLANIVFPQESAPPADSIDLMEIMEKPSPEYPEGFYCIRAGEKILTELVPFKWKTKQGEPYFPVVHFCYDKVPGSLLARTPCFDLIEKQKTRNRIEALGEMILTRMSAPTWLLPKGTIDEPTGIPGGKLTWDPHQTDGAKPEIIPAAQFPPAIVAWLDRVDRDFAELTAMYEVNRGERPLSVKSGYALQELQEIASDRNTGLFMNYSISTSEWQQQNFEIFRQTAPADRYARILGQNDAWTIAKVQETDLAGGVDIWAEPGINQPKTATERLAHLELLINTGVIDLQDPLQKLRIAREYGVGNIFPSADIDNQQIARETDYFKRGLKPPLLSSFENKALHLQDHMDYAKTSEFEALAQQPSPWPGPDGQPLVFGLVWLNHIKETQAALQQEEQAAMQQQLQAQQAASQAQQPPQPQPQPQQPANLRRVA